ncbi:hypothetical protein ACIGNX_17865 [Actinosynnema sp. NPDC053489]|uniref:hypothetical protein n=1 Tax=Actinosynnema sp. NPDC053489 TaxID=3363916 RepID=UPI0037CBD250
MPRCGSGSPADVVPSSPAGAALVVTAGHGVVVTAKGSLAAEGRKCRLDTIG